MEKWFAYLLKKICKVCNKISQVIHLPCTIWSQFLFSERFPRREFAGGGGILGMSQGVKGILFSDEIVEDADGFPFVEIISSLICKKNTNILRT